jgi:hypothetical protein
MGESRRKNLAGDAGRINIKKAVGLNGIGFLYPVTSSLFIASRPAPASLRPTNQAAERRHPCPEQGVYVGPLRDEFNVAIGAFIRSRYVIGLYT